MVDMTGHDPVTHFAADGQGTVPHVFFLIFNKLERVVRGGVMRPFDANDRTPPPPWGGVPTPVLSFC